MDLPDYAHEYSTDKIEELALNTLRDWYGGNIKLPVPVDTIIEAGSYVDRIILLEGLSRECRVSGTLVVKPNSVVVIVVDKDEYECDFVRGRFTLAHEFGHFLMHDAVWNHPKAFTDEEAVYINEFLENVYGTIEAQADYFARALLMPIDLFIAFVKEVYSACSETLRYDYNNVVFYVAKKCSVKFHVPRDDVEFRLESTGCDALIREATRRKNEFLSRNVK